MLRGQKVAKGVWGAQRNGIWEPQTLPFSLSKQASARPWGLMHVCRSGRERVRGRAAGWREYHGGRDAYITDLVLGLLDSLEFRCVCHYAEAFALVLLKLLLVAHLTLELTLLLEAEVFRGVGHHGKGLLGVVSAGQKKQSRGHSRERARTSGLLADP